MFSSWRKPRRLGIAQDKGRYDLPLNQSAGTNFLILLVALMNFLAVMAVCATFVLGDISKAWSSGLENKLTIEIPAMKDDKSLRSPDEIETLLSDSAKVLENNPNVEQYEILEKKDIHDLVSPWLGEGAAIDDLPLPGLISVHLHIRSPERVKELQKNLRAIHQDIRLDTHEDWLGDILRIASTMKVSALLVTLIIMFTTITAIAGAIRSRMAEHEADIELLHLMGASDPYITKQLQRHAVVLTFKGSLAGLFAGALAILILMLLGGHSQSGLFSNMGLSYGQALILCLLPFLMSLIASYAARITVLRVLEQMP